MQFAIDLPDKLFFDLQEILPQQDLKKFVLEAVEAKFLQEKRKKKKEKRKKKTATTGINGNDKSHSAS
ncbi:MAG: hypothetical protein WAX77_00655 [Methylococcaceae bacterium]